MATPSFLQASLSTGRCCDPKPPSRHKTAKPRLRGSHTSGPGRGAITSSPFLGLGSTSGGHRPLCPCFPSAKPEKVGFRSGWAYDGGAVVVPQSARCRNAEINNEGAPFRCLGPHTHRKAPAEAQARFSEDPAKQFYRIRIKAAQPDTTGRPNMTRRTFLI